MRLIDADALKGVIFSKSHRMEDLWDTAGILNLINNAPTVERPQGEWKLDSIGAYCSECKTHPDYTTNYCGNCGAKMKGGAGDGL